MLPSSTEIIVGALQRFMQSAGQAFHGQSFVNGSIAAAWRLAISDADWLVHSLNRGLSATVSDRCGRTPCFVFSKSPSWTRRNGCQARHEICRSALSPLRDRTGITDGACTLNTWQWLPRPEENRFLKKGLQEHPARFWRSHSSSASI
jgi:hypothetical protein